MGFLKKNIFNQKYLYALADALNSTFSFDKHFCNTFSSDFIAL